MYAIWILYHCEIDTYHYTNSWCYNPLKTNNWLSDCAGPIKLLHEETIHYTEYV